MSAPISVFLLDDHEIVRRGVRDLLEAEGDIRVIGEASTEAEAIARVHALDPDVAVLDVRLQDGNGIEACRGIRALHPRTACLILTSFDDDEALFQAIMAGAAGYVLKQIRSSELIDAVRRVAAGQSLLDPVVTARVLERLRTGPEQDARIARLSAQERHVLELLAEGLTNRQIGRAPVPRREDGQELRDVGSVEDGDGPSHRGRGLRGEAPRPAASAAVTRAARRSAGRSALVDQRQRSAVWSHDDGSSRLHGPLDQRVLGSPSLDDVGRLAVSITNLPDIFPINYVVDRGTVVFRTAEGTKLAAAVLGRGVAFEVDGVDDAAGEAWSVVIKGHAVEIERHAGSLRRHGPAAVPLACRTEAPFRAHRARGHLRTSVRDRHHRRR